jgi:hypothetical protein
MIGRARLSFAAELEFFSPLPRARCDSPPSLPNWLAEIRAMRGLRGV